MRHNRVIAGGICAAFLAACSGGDHRASGAANLAGDPEYRAMVKESVNSGILEGKSESEAYAEAIDYDLHYLYVGFLELYPDTPHRAGIEQSLTRFKLFTSKKTQILMGDALAEMCWPASGRISHWRVNNSAVGVIIGGPRTYFGPMLIWSETGSIQLMGGAYKDAPGGYEFNAGTSFIYSTKCHEEAE